MGGLLDDNKLAIANAFGRAASQYDKHARFQRQVADRLLLQIAADLTGKKVLDVGCGTGYLAQQLQHRGARVMCLDLSQAMLDQAKNRLGSDAGFCLADAEAIPFPDRTFDLVVSSLALQWCNDLSRPLTEMQRVCAPSGQVFFSTLAHGSLTELQASWRCIDEHQHVNRFLARAQILASMQQSGAGESRLEFETITLWYESALHLMRDLKGIGATRVSGRQSGLTKPGHLQRVDAQYRALFMQDKGVPATYQVGLGSIQL